MDYMPVVDVSYGIDELVKHSRNILLVALEARHQLSALHELHQQEQVVLVTEVPVEFDYVGVVQQVQNLHFQQELGLHFVFRYGRLEYLLQGEQEASGAVSANVDLPKFARSDALSQLEVSQTESWRLPHSRSAADHGLLDGPHVFLELLVASNTLLAGKDS